MEMRRPETKTEGSHSSGQLEYISNSSIHIYAEKGKALTNMLKMGEPTQNKWGAESSESFQTLKAALTQNSFMRLSNFEKQFVLQTYASGPGLGAVVLHEYDGVSEFAGDVYEPKAQWSRNSLFDNGARVLSSVLGTKRVHVYHEIVFKRITHKG